MNGGGVLALGWPWDPFVDLLSKPFEAAAGWAWDTVISGITDWIAKGFIMLVSFVWVVMDRTSTPHLTSEWFTTGTGAPYMIAIGAATGLLLIFVFAALIQGVFAGQPMVLVRRLFADTPAAVAGILFTAAFAQIAIDVVDAMSDGVWSLTRPRATNAVDGLLLVSSKLPGTTFLGPLVLLIGMLGMFFLWLVLLARTALVYLVVALCPLAWATSVWPAIAGIRRKTIELLVGLIVSKLVIAMALAVGLGALGGVGTTGNPGDGVIANGLAEYGTLVAGIITFGMAAFMPFLVLKLIPVVERAAVADEVRSAPMRAAGQMLQYAYYVQGVQSRLAGTGSAGGAAGGAVAGSAGGGSGGSGGGGFDLAGGGEPDGGAPSGSSGAGSGTSLTGSGGRRSAGDRWAVTGTDTSSTGGGIGGARAPSRTSGSRIASSGSAPPSASPASSDNPSSTTGAGGSHSAAGTATSSAADRPIPSAGDDSDGSS